MEAKAKSKTEISNWVKERTERIDNDDEYMEINKTSKRETVRLMKGGQEVWK